MMRSLTKTPLQRALLFLTLIISIVIQCPQPELDLDLYSSLALKHVHKTENSAPPDPQAPLKGVNIVVTGATSGLGLDLTKALYNLGGTLIVIGRSKTKLSKVVHEIVKDPDDDNRLIPVLADLQDLNAVSAAAKEISSKFKSIDFLINNAGLFSSNWATPQGYDMVFGVNYLSHFLLTEKLLPNLKSSEVTNGSRIIQISSTCHHMVNGDDLIPSEGSFSPLASEHSTSFLHLGRAYGNSKLAQIYHMRSLARDLSSQNVNVKIASLCPTFVATHIGGNVVGNTVMGVFGFPSDGWGLAPILFAMFHPDAGTKDSEGNYDDYVQNSKIFVRPVTDILNIFFKCTQSIPIFRLAIGNISGGAVLLFQRLFADVGFQSSSFESYDIEKQEALYKWSKEAIAAWM
jgi:NAD(P)-dependent dehydrogenase (short-subunit alcohol dehydrogenase family)